MRISDWSSDVCSSDLLAISDTRIDEDTFAAGLDYERLEMQRDVAIRVGVVGAQPIATLDDLVLGRLDENRWICSERRKLEDPRDACCTDRPPLEGLIVVHTCRHMDAPRTCGAIRQTELRGGLS